MKDITKFLKESYYCTDDAPVHIGLKTTMGNLRKDRGMLDALAADITQLKIDQQHVANTTTVRPARARKGAHVVLQADVLDAVRQRHTNAKSIAQAIGAEAGQVRKALSRYAKQGLLVRKAQGEYRLK